jgi:hypothetical protein
MDRDRGGRLRALDSNICSAYVGVRSAAYADTVALLYEAQHVLAMGAGATGSFVADKGDVFDFYNAMRAIVDQAHSELFVVDPYIDTDFVNRYVRPLRLGLSIRLLTTKTRWTADVVTSCELLSTQRNEQIELRESSDLHGRFIFMDGKRGFQSDPSMKDGAKNAVAVVVEMLDILDLVLSKFNERWSSATVLLPPR